MSFGAYLIMSISFSTLFENHYYKQLCLWILFYLISDFIMLSLVFGSYLVFKKSLYRYAKRKFIITQILLILNFLLFGYGVYIIA